MTTGQRRDWGMPILLFVLALCLRFFLIDQKNLWFDEVYSWHVARGSFSSILGAVARDVHPPLYYFLLKIWMNLFSDGIAAMRSLSAIFGSFAVFPVYGIARSVLPKRESLAAAAFFAISPLGIFFGQEARMYAPNLLFNSAAVYFLSKVLEGEGRERVLFAFGFCASTVLALYTHYYSALLFATEAVFLLSRAGRIDRGTRRVLSAAFGTAALSFAPWIPVLWRQIGLEGPWRAHPTFGYAISQFPQFLNDVAFGRYVLLSLHDDLPFFEAAAFFLLVPCLVALFFTSRRPVSESKVDPNPMRLIFWLASGPLAASYALGFFRMLDLSRYLVIVLPFLIVLFVSWASARSPGPRAVALAAFVVCNLVGLNLYFRADFKLNDFRGVFARIERAEPSPLYVYPPYDGLIVDYYRQHGLYRIPRRVDYGETFDQLAEKMKNDGPDSFWMVLDENSGEAPQYRDYLARLSAGYRVEEEISFPLWPAPVRLYRFRRP